MPGVWKTHPSCTIWQMISHPMFGLLYNIGHHKASHSGSYPQRSKMIACCYYKDICLTDPYMERWRKMITLSPLIYNEYNSILYHLSLSQTWTHWGLADVAVISKSVIFRFILCIDFLGASHNICFLAKNGHCVFYHNIESKCISEF